MTDDPLPDQPSQYGPVVQALDRLGALRTLPTDDLSDWTAYPQAACLPDEVIADASVLARFLGGDDTSFTGDLLRLIAKARFSPENLNRLAVGFPRHVTAWIMWDTLCYGAPPTAAGLAQVLTFAYSGLKRTPAPPPADPD